VLLHGSVSIHVFLQQLLVLEPLVAMQARVSSGNCVQFYMLNELRQHTEDLGCFATRVVALEKVVLSAGFGAEHRVHPELVHARKVVLTP